MDTVKAVQPTTQLEVESAQPQSGQNKQIFYTYTLFFFAGDSVKVLVRKQSESNPADFFDRSFADYQKGFSANGELKRKPIYNLSNNLYFINIK